MMRRTVALVVGFLLFASIATNARADQKTTFYADQLRGNDDYRVRTQAALALGASNDDSAVTPLCKALTDDGNVSVRVAAAAALGKLGRSTAESCLQTAKGKESSSSVKSQIDRSLTAVRNGGSAPPPPGPDAKYYVAVDVQNKTSRPSTEIEGLVRGAMQAKLLAKTGFAVAPKGQSNGQGEQIMREKKLKGFILMASVEPPVYSGGSLTQVINVTILSYPQRAMRARAAPKLTQEDTPTTDHESETVLIKMCAEKAIENFQKVMSTL